MRSTLALACLSLVWAKTSNFDAISVKLDGQDKRLYLSDCISDGRDIITCFEGSRAILSETPYLDPYKFFKPQL